MSDINSQLESVKEGEVNFFSEYFLDLFISYSKDLSIFPNCIHPLISKEKCQKKQNSDIVKENRINPLLVNTLAETMFFGFIFIQFAKFEGFSLISSFKKIFNINLVVHFCIFSYQAEGFNGCYDKLCTTKWFDFCSSRTLRVIFMPLINDGR